MAAACSEALGAPPAGRAEAASAGTGALAGIASGPAGAVLVEGARVLVLPPGETAPDEALAAAVTDSGGAFAVHGLPEGSYDLRLARGALRGATLGVHVTAGRTTPTAVELR